MFEVHEQPAHVANFNPRAEKHGDENVLAADIKLELTCHSSALDAFNPNLRQLLYREPATGEQPSLPFGGDSADRCTALRVPQLAPLAWNEYFPGYRLQIVKGMGLQDPIDLVEVELSGFKFEALDGGSVLITCRATCHPDADQSGQLCELIQEDVEITLMPPAPAAVAQTSQGDLVGAGAGMNALVTGIELVPTKGGTLKQAKVVLSDGDIFNVGDWAYRPTLDEIAIALHEVTGASIEFTPAVRSDYDAAEAA